VDSCESDKMRNPLRLNVVLLLLIPVTSARSEVQVTAFSGEPFGVAEITLTDSDLFYVPPQNAAGSSFSKAADVAEHLGNNTFYAVASERRVGGTESWTVRFLFHGTEPFDVQSGRTSFSNFAITPVSDSDRHAELLKQWWSDFSFRSNRAVRDSLHPTHVDFYLATMLPRRLGFEEPAMTTRSYLNGDFADFVGFMTGTDAIRLAMQKEAMLDTQAESIRADEPLPKPITPPPVAIPDPDPDVKVEPIAMAVPQECFYARFGSFRSFLWFRDRVDQWGAELRDLASVRGLDYELTNRLQQQLALPDSELSRVLGTTVVDDVAIIGQDTFIREGAAIGVLFQAASNVALSASLNAHRDLQANTHENVLLEDVTLKGFEQPVSFLHSTDNRVRSFYARHGDFHLITTSRHIARRFLESASQKKDSLGASKEFRHARTVMPIDFDSVFLYLSDAFFRTFVEPHYRIEMTRRARSETEIMLVHIAQLAARSEGQPHATLAELIEGEFLPRGFDQRSDGSRLVLQDGDWVDSLRGSRGTFLPVPDVELTGATAAEVAAYREFGQRYQRIWVGMDPAMLAIKRATNGKIEHITLDLHAFPIPLNRFWLLNLLKISEQPMTVAGMEDLPVYAEGYIMGVNPAFVGLFDEEIPFTIEDGRLVKDGEGSWLLAGGNLMAPQASDVPGISKAISPFAGRPGWRYVSDDFDVFGTSREHLEQLSPQLELRKAVRPAKLRVRLGDLSQSKLAPVINAGGWLEAKRAVAGNLLWLNRLNSQLHIRPSECLSVSHRILNATLVHPLSGRYVDGNTGVFSSENEAHRGEYVFPALQWLSKATFEINTEGNVLTSRAVLWLRPLVKPQ
jgi:hypothetical protein